MLSVLEARVNVCVEASRSVGSNFLFGGLTLKEKPSMSPTNTPRHEWVVS